MDILQNKDGFSLVSNSVKYDFVSDIAPICRGSHYELCITGIIPVPLINKGDRLLLPIDEGIAIRADGNYISGESNCERIVGNFCGREGTMSMVIVERQNRFLLIALDNGTNASYSACKENELYQLAMTTKKECKVTYGIFNKLSEACKYYRDMKNLNPVTLSEKLKRNPEIQKLIGGGIFWIWNNNYDEVMYSEQNTNISPVVGKDLLSIADRIFSLGVERALFGVFFNGDSHFVRELYKKYGYIATQYDNYNDVLNPEMLKIIPSNRANNCDYTRRRMADYPNGLQINNDGSPTKVWALKGFDGNYYRQNLLCPLVAAKRMREEIPKVLNEFPYYKGRFIDCFGAGISECFSKEHPLTREECINVKRNAFSFLGDIGLIAGTEDCFEDIINGLVYSEGLHSPINFRCPDSGRKHAHMYDTERSEHIKRQMLNPECRVPLWQLVYHDCLLAFPYWGDSTASSHELLKYKVLFACLYGCPPLYSFFVKDFEYLENDIISSYKLISEVHQKVATLPMTDFEVLSDDYNLQRSVFGNKYEVVANFSDKPRVYNNEIIQALDFIFKELL